MEKPWYRKWFGQAGQTLSAPVRAKADAGDPEAQYLLGLKHASGEGEAQDYLEAARWYRLAADQDHALAQYNLGVMYSRGQGFPKDDTTASQWFEKAALQGDPGAQFNLGVRCQRASYRTQSTEASEAKIEAYKWYRLAVAQGYRNSAEACDTLCLGMTNEEVAEAGRRAAAFVPHKNLPSAPL
jgi:TPR repeat protein